HGRSTASMTTRTRSLLLLNTATIFHQVVDPAQLELPTGHVAGLRASCYIQGTNASPIRREPREVAPGPLDRDGDARLARSAARGWAWRRRLRHRRRIHGAFGRVASRGERRLRRRA